MSKGKESTSFDLIRGKTFATPHGEEALELVSLGNRRICITTATKQERDFWWSLIKLFIDTWDEIITQGSINSTPRPDSVYDVIVVPKEIPNVDSSDASTTTRKVLKAAQGIFGAAEKGIEVAAQKTSGATQVGLTYTLQSAPVIGGAFAVMGYGLDIAERYASHKKALPKAMELALQLSEQCIQDLVSLERLRQTHSWSGHDEVRYKQKISALEDLELAIRILSNMQINRGRKQLLDAFFAKQGEADKMLNVTLETCRSRLNDVDTRSSLMGVDLIRSMLDKACEQLDASAEASNVLIESNQRIEVGISALVEAVVSGGRYTSKLLEDDLLGRIKSCHEIRDFVDVYDSKPFQQSLRRLLVAQGEEEDVEKWAKNWAERLRKGDEDAVTLNEDRKACLLLLYILCDQWKDESNSAVTEALIVREFKGTRVENILGRCLVMDRAQCLYNMCLTGKPKPGMHWVSKQEVSESDEWKKIMDECGGRPTKNKRLQWLMGVEGLRLRENRTLRRWMEPQETKFDVNANYHSD